MPTWEQLLGIGGLTVAAIYAVRVLWTEHLRADADDRKDRDDWKAIALGLQKDIGRLEAIEEALGLKR